MMNKYLLPTLFSFILIVQIARSQELTYGFSFGVSLNGITQYYNGDYNSVHDNSSGFIFWDHGGLNIGLNANKTLSPIITLQSDITYRRSHLGAQYFLYQDGSGTPIGSENMRIVSNNIRMNEWMSFNIHKSFHLGLGVYLDGLLKSTSVFKFKGALIEPNTRFKNTYYQFFTMGILGSASFVSDKNEYVFMISQGLIDKIKGENQIKEFDTSFNFGIIHTLNF